MLDPEALPDIEAMAIVFKHDAILMPKPKGFQIVSCPKVSNYLINEAATAAKYPCFKAECNIMINDQHRPPPMPSIRKDLTNSSYMWCWVARDLMS